MILTNHGKHLTDAFADLRERSSEITVFTEEGDIVSFNKCLLQFFSPFVREVLASIPQDSTPALIIPASNLLALKQMENLLSKGAAAANSVSFQDVNDLVELGKLFRVDLSRISYEQNMSVKSFELGESPIVRATVDNDISKARVEQAGTEYAELSQSRELKEPVIKEEPREEDNLLSFCEGIKGLIGKSLGIENKQSEESSTPAQKIKQEVTVEENLIQDVFDVESGDEDSPHNNRGLTNSQLSSNARGFERQNINEVVPYTLNVENSSKSLETHAQARHNVMMNSEVGFYPAMQQQMPIHMPIAPGGMRMYPSSFIMETPPPPDVFPRYHQNMGQGISPHQPQSHSTGAIFISPKDYQNKMQEFNESRRERMDQQSPKKMKLSCKRCKVYETSDRGNLKRHQTACQRLNPKGIPLKCKICAFGNTNPIKFHNHVRNEHMELISACQYCEFTSFYKNQLKKHMVEYHNLGYGGNVQDLSRSQNSAGTSRNFDRAIYSCLKCDYVGPHESALRQHNNMKHENADKKHEKKEMSSNNSKLSSRRKEKGWGPDDNFTCDYWNFENCKHESDHISGLAKIARHHVCSLCFRNIGDKEPHPATQCRIFPLPGKDQNASRSREAVAVPHMVRGLYMVGNRSSPREDGEVD